mmetsp:Transcript_15961/g.43493  ORF Transcript_15961/g.43493 Transcript_15961/m.43493 type:complete len:257 (-) Transcript_15961:1252-2022(-)
MLQTRLALLSRPTHMCPILMCPPTCKRPCLPQSASTRSSSRPPGLCAREVGRWRYCCGYANPPTRPLPFSCLETLGILTIAGSWMPTQRSWSLRLQPPAHKLRLLTLNLPSSQQTSSTALPRRRVCSTSSASMAMMMMRSTQGTQAMMTTAATGGNKPQGRQPKQQQKLRRWLLRPGRYLHQHQRHQQRLRLCRRNKWQPRAPVRLSRLHLRSHLLLGVSLSRWQAQLRMVVLRIKKEGRGVQRLSLEGMRMRRPL